MRKAQLVCEQLSRVEVTADNANRIIDELKNNRGESMLELAKRLNDVQENSR